jgi:hypothetical protein
MTGHRGIAGEAQPGAATIYQGVVQAQIEYDDRDRSALPSFPWEQLRQAIAIKLEESGMRLIHVNGVGDDHARAAVEPTEDEAPVD